MDIFEGKQPVKKKSYTWYLSLTVLLIVITIIVGIIVFSYYFHHFSTEQDAGSYDRYYVMIASDTTASLWQPIYEGAYEAGLEENCYVDFLNGSFANTNDYSREDLMRVAIASEADGIIVEADESDEMTELINQAAAEGIPVITLYGDNTQSDRCSFVGVGSYDLGREYGRQVLKIAQERQDAGSITIYTDDEAAEDGALSNKRIGSDRSFTDVAGQAMVVEEGGNQEANVMILVNAYAQDSGQNILCSGIQETIDKEKEKGMDISLSLVSIDDSSSFAVEESIRDIFMEGELPDIIVCLNELCTTCVYQAVIDYNKVGQVNILGYYDSDTILRAIDRNVIYATIAVDTQQMGRSCVEALTEYNAVGNTSQYFIADIELIDKENVEQYMSIHGRGDSEDE